MVEIRAAEGGDDAKMLVDEQFSVYAKACALAGVTVESVETRPGLRSFSASGERAAALFALEPGGHRWQRVPPNERHGRRHTSTVTVAVMPMPADRDVESVGFQPDEIAWTATRGSGAGGQHRNVTDSAIDMIHMPTGITVHIESERSQHQNRRLALRVLAARVNDAARKNRDSRDRSERRRQVGTGMRGDKVRTVRMQDGRVIDHRTGKRTTLVRYLAGHIEDVAA